MPISRRRLVSTMAAVAATASVAGKARASRYDDPYYDRFEPHRSDLDNRPAFQHGVASGDPLADRVIIWTRVTPRSYRPLYGHWKIATDPLLNNVVNSGRFHTGPRRDFTVKIDVARLASDTTYYFQFKALGQASPIGRTRTLPVGAVDHARLAVASCSNIAFGFFGAYGHISRRADLNAVLHLGDYLYEYADRTFGSGEGFGRTPFPNKEILTLSDYRHRHGQYKADLHLQECHRQHPFICVWDDHEFTNDAWVGGAENHQDDEGDWLARKQRALRAYFEWQPIREHGPMHAHGRMRRSDNIFRSFGFGDLLDLMMLETRVSARSQQLPSIIDTSGNVAVDPAEIPGILASLADPARELLGSAQREWLFAELSTSQQADTCWRVVGQQTMIGQLLAPVPQAPGQPPLLLPFNMDQWDGYQAERARLFSHLTTQSISDVVVCTGDIHSSWAQDIAPNPFDPAGGYNPFTGEGSLGVEFVTPGITSPAFDEATAAVFEPQVLAAPHVNYVNLSKQGYMVVDLNRSRAQADWYHMVDVP